VIHCHVLQFCKRIIDKTLPAVSSASPLNYATGVASTANVSATFADSGTGVDPDTISNSTFQVVREKPTGKVPVSGTVSYDESSQTATFDPSNSLAKGLYRATLTTSVKDKAGNALANDYTWTFATVGPPRR
jgi:Big-like domain-containing protein